MQGKHGDERPRKPSVERVKFGSGAKVGDANGLTFASSGATLGANFTITFLGLFSFSG